MRNSQSESQTIGWIFNRHTPHVSDYFLSLLRKSLMWSSINNQLLTFLPFLSKAQLYSCTRSIHYMSKTTYQVINIDKIIKTIWQPAQLWKSRVLAWGTSMIVETLEIMRASILTSEAFVMFPKIQTQSLVFWWTIFAFELVNCLTVISGEILK